MNLVFYHPGFEEEVRAKLNIDSRPITEEDALCVTELDLSEFDFMQEDQAVLSLFRNLSFLYINIYHTEPSFWNNFPQMRELYLCYGNDVDFKAFKEMKKLEGLFVSGGDYSSIDYLNLEAIVNLPCLQYLELHEFGTVDLLPLGQMQQLKIFALRYADKVANIEIIGSMQHLDRLVLDGLYVDDLDFLDLLPDTIQLEMCGNHLRSGVDVRKWKRFSKRDICEISVSDPVYSYIDLSPLND